MERRSPDEIAAAVHAAYASGKLPTTEAVAFGHMFSADQDLAPSVGAFHPHVMVFTPYYENAMLGGSKFGGMLPSSSEVPSRRSRRRTCRNRRAAARVSPIAWCSRARCIGSAPVAM